jgi:squalene-hopene/tetraprenyl-beta-curcumene cyclase
VSSAPHLSPDRLCRCYQIARDALLAERNAAGHWTGELSTSALSTATAVMALEMVRRARSPLAPLAGRGFLAGGEGRAFLDSNREQSAETSAPHPQPLSPFGGEGGTARDFDSLIARGIAWLVEHQNPDGGWGDTTKSFSNISTTMLCHAVLHAVESRESRVESHDGGHGLESSQLSTLDAQLRAQNYIDRAGGVPAVIARYGKDKTFSVPILTHCAMAGLVDWREITPLPFELACLPANFYKWVRLPVVSYALPALIAIGQARHHFAPSRNPLVRWMRNAAVGKSLRVLERIQPPNGGFLEATPLTSFVTMSLAGIGLADHPVARRGIDFIVKSVRPDGSWPIDTNLATWVTTLSINALGKDLPADAAPPLLDWLLGQQYRTVHPYTNADPGGWAWTDLPGGVPDADDTPGAVLAVLLLGVRAGRMEDGGSKIEDQKKVLDAVRFGVRWLLELQNRDGGWPTFCRGWGTLPFDRSGSDLTAHAVRALTRHFDWEFNLRRTTVDCSDDLEFDLHCLENGEEFGALLGWRRYISRTQHPDGSWLPLWFGNQHCPNDENKTYGTARVLAAYRDCGRMEDQAVQRGLAWLRANQNEDGGWGGAKGTPSSVEETALAVEMLVSADQWQTSRSTTHDPRSTIHDPPSTILHPPPVSIHCPPSTVHPTWSPEATRGLTWLCEAVETGKYREASPIGFYFAKLWYFEKLYPIIFTVAALGRAVRSV